MKYSLLFCIFFSLVCRVAAQYEPPQGIYPDVVFNENIKTVRLLKAGIETSYPIGQIDDKNPLELTFDELAKNARNYSYIIIHCDADWQQSRLNTAEYMDGFTVNHIRQYDYSFNTLMQYVHYRISIPSEDVRLRVSGNYVIIVFEDGNEDQPILCKRFCMVEPTVVISGVAGQAQQTAYRRDHQQVDFVIRTPNFPVDNAQREIKTVILKNDQWHTALTNIKPVFIRPGELDYRNQNTTLFPAGNEYRPLDIKSIRYTSTPMRAIEFERPTYHFYPYIDLPRNTGRYIHYEDFNGAYSIQAEKINHPDVESDYVYVHFALKTQALTDGQVYVFGAFNNYACQLNNRMTYNDDTGQYEASILLKQGYYNYLYVFVPSGKSTIDDTRLEGNFFDTENNYLLYVYYRGRTDRYDKLVGISVMNTLNK